MLIKLIKLAGWFVFKLAMWVLLPIGKLIYRLTWKGTPQDFVTALVTDPQITRAATEAGMAGILQMYAAKLRDIASMRPPITQEDRDWGMFIQNYGENPQPDMVPAYFRYVIKGGTTGSTELPTAGAIVALCQRHASKEWPEWSFVPEFAKLFVQALEWQHADPDRPGWNDFYMAQWFVLRQDHIAATIAERTKLPGMVGSTCTWMANSVAQQIPAFKEALERVGYEFPAPDMGAAIRHDAGKTEFQAAVEAERRYPMSVKACNEFLQTLHGATITGAEMMVVEGRSEDEGEEHIEIITTSGMFCIIAPDLGISFTSRLPRDPAPAAKQNGSAAC